MKSMMVHYLFVPHYMVLFFALTEIIRLGRRCLEGSNALAYCPNEHEVKFYALIILFYPRFSQGAIKKTTYELFRRIISVRASYPKSAHYILGQPFAL